MREARLRCKRAALGFASYTASMRSFLSISVGVSFGLMVAVSAFSAMADGDADAGPPPQPDGGEAVTTADAGVATDAEAGVVVRFEPGAPHIVLEQRPEHRRGDQLDWEGTKVICTAGCETTLSPGKVYQVGGTGVSPGAFVTPKNGGPYRITVEPGSPSSDAAGIALVLAGGGALLLGGGATAVLFGTGATKNARDDDPIRHVVTASLTTAVIGLILIGISVPLRLAGDTKVHLTPSKP
jgi:hypothetical protein